MIYRILRKVQLAACVAVCLFGLTSHAQGLLHGDCDETGEVEIHNVQLCANIYIGTALISACPVCDLDGDGEVAINEVQGVANCYQESTSPGCHMVTPAVTPLPTVTLPPPTSTPPPTPVPTDTPAPTSTATSVPTDTPPSTPTATAAEPTATATQGNAICGNSMIEPGETCDDGNTMTGDACPPDCAITSCAPAGTMTAVEVRIQTSQSLASITVLLEYPDGTVQIPGSSNQTQVIARVVNRPSGFVPSFNDLNYALLGTLSSGSFTLTNAQRIYVVNFDRCSDAPLVTAGDFNCFVLEAVNPSLQQVPGVTCSVTVP